jgi:hypothetical protein
MANPRLEEAIDTAKNGEAERVQSMLVNGADVNKRDSDGQTALMEAAKGGHIDLAAQLLASGASIKAVSDNSGVRIRTKPTIENGEIVGSLDKDEQAIILGKSRQEEIIKSMTARWYRIKTEEGTVGYSYGYFFTIDEWELKAVPTLHPYRRQPMAKGYTCRASRPRQDITEQAIIKAD